jgi:hypothetical protein
VLDLFKVDCFKGAGGWRLTGQKEEEEEKTLILILTSRF